MGKLNIDIHLNGVESSDIEGVQTAIDNFVSNSGFELESKTLNWSE